MNRAGLWLLASLIAAVPLGCSSTDCVESYREVGGPEAPCVAASSTSSAASETAACFQKPQICPDLSPIRFCSRLGGSTNTINILLDNRGESELTLSRIQLRGDARCAFKQPRTSPEVGEAIKPGASAVFQFRYAPPAGAGEDHAAIEILSDAENLPSLLIPVCGRAVTSTIGIDPSDCLPCEDRTQAEVSDCEA